MMDNVFMGVQDPIIVERMLDEVVKVGTCVIVIKS